jgi:signal transduction histidine kinase/integral membrane sensor domain MASE1
VAGLNAPSTSGLAAPAESRAGRAFPRLWLEILLLALAYTAVGWFSRPPSFLGALAQFASPIWPAAGLALGALLVRGRQLWPGVWLGCLAITAMELGRTHDVAQALAGGAVIAAGATLQALLGHAFARRFVGGNMTLDTVSSVLRFIAYCGIVASLASATIGVTTLSLLSDRVPVNLFVNWLSWWSGDTIGVLLTTPIVLTLAWRQRPVWKTRPLLFSLPLLLGILILSLSLFFVDQLERANRQAEFHKAADRAHDALRMTFGQAEEVSASLLDFYRAVQRVDRRQFDAFAQGIHNRHPAIQALEWIPRVAHGDLVEHERATRAEGISGYAVFEKNSQGGRHPVAARSEYFPVHFVYPLAGNEKALGYDLGSETMRRKAIEDAIRARRTVASAPIRLIQEKGDQYGVLAFAPFFRADAAGGIPHVQGLTLTVIRVGQLADSALAGLPAGMGYRLEDVASPQGSGLLVESASVSPARVFTRDYPFEFAGRHWRLSVFAGDEYRFAHFAWYTWATLASALLLSAAGTLFLLVMSGRTARTEQLVAERTAELGERNAQLDAIFQLTPDGLVSFDHAGDVRSVNAAFLRMTGLQEAEVLGRPQSELEALLRERAEVPEQWPGLEPCFAKADGPGTPAERRAPMLLSLRRPQAAVLELLGVSGDAAAVGRLLYLHDVTHEVEVDRMKSEFLSHAAHELRTPMASIYGFTELLLAKQFDEATRADLLQTIHRETTWLIEIINELLDLSRIESRRGRDLKIEDVPLAPVVEEVLASLQIDPARWPVSVDLDADLPPVKADVAKLRQVLINVLGNAVKYSPKGGGIGISASEIDGRQGERQVAIVVSDQGIGMTPAQATRVCERFYRADTSGNTAGTGLGMAIVKEVMELLGGRVEVTSTLGAGTAVTLRLSTARNSQREAAPA